ncbi:MAG: AEC family transporter [Clostridia bacterium]|nr:AEC family transporter [Clostridia bacterium]
MFVSTLIRVLTMLAYAIPGFLFIKTKAVKQDAIPAFAKLLLYVCSPCLSLYSFSRAEYSTELHGMIWLCFAATMFLLLSVILFFRLVLRKQYDNVAWRVFIVATSLGNVGYFGVPLLEYFLSDYPFATVFSQIFSLSMNIVAWTVGMFVISRDKRFIRPKKLFTVPLVLSMVIAYPMFLLGWHFPPAVEEAIQLLGRMSTPLCMIVLGMRLATVKFTSLITDWRAFLAAGTKMILFPLFAWAVMLLLPVDPYVKASIFLLACCPCASIIQSLSELIGQGQKQAANTVLIATMLCVITIPVMSELFLPLILQ